MPEPNNPRDPDSGASPQNIADIKLRLLHNAPNDPDTRLAVEELARMGADAMPLIPLVVELYVSDRLSCLLVETVVELYRSTRSDELLKAWRDRGGHCSPYDRCRLLELGVTDFEDDLLLYLWQNWEKADDFLRSHIATTLGRYGSAKSLEMMKVIQYKLGANVQELRAVLPDDWQEKPAFESKGIEGIGHSIFLMEIREAVTSLRRRCSASDRSGPQNAMKAPETTERPSHTAVAQALPQSAEDERTEAEAQGKNLAGATPTPFGEYNLLEQVTKGGMAEAFAARHRISGRKVFLKRVKLLSGDDATTIRREADIYSRLMRAGLSGVLRIENAAHCEEYYFLVTEYADGGDLEEYVNAAPGKHLQPSEAKGIALEIASTLCNLHAFDKPIVHRDLKPGNILRVNGVWKIGDFGIAKNLTRLITRQTFQRAGTSGYAPQEQLDGVEAHPSADVYAFGKILVFLLSGQTDVDHIHFPRWRDLIVRCTDRDRDRRPDTAAVLAELQSILV